MLLHLTDLSEEPLQMQIVRQIREKILKGELEQDSPLPSIRVLAHQSKVSVITVQRAYEILENAGLINARRGKGFYVAEINESDRKRQAAENLAAKLMPALRAALKEGLTIKEVTDTFKSTINNINNGDRNA